MSQLNNMEYTTKFGSDSQNISKVAMIVAKSKKLEILYMTKKGKDIISIIKCEANSKLLYKRFGYMSKK